MKWVSPTPPPHPTHPPFLQPATSPPLDPLHPSRDFDLQRDGSLSWEAVWRLLQVHSRSLETASNKTLWAKVLSPGNRPLLRVGTNEPIWKITTL